MDFISLIGSCHKSIGEKFKREFFLEKLLDWPYKYAGLMKNLLIY